MDAHINIVEKKDNPAEQLAKEIMYQAICNGNPVAMSRLQKEGGVETVIDLRRDAPVGQRQVESLLRFVVSSDLERSMEDAEGDQIVYDGLGEHRILGTKRRQAQGR